MMFVYLCALVLVSISNFSFKNSIIITSLKYKYVLIVKILNIINKSIISNSDTSFSLPQDCP